MKKMKAGTACKFTEASGNPPMSVTIASSEKHNGLIFYRIQEHSGLYLHSSLAVA